MAGLELYRKYHPGRENAPYASLEQVWTESEDWDDLVEPHVKAVHDALPTESDM